MTGYISDEHLTLIKPNLFSQRCVDDWKQIETDHKRNNKYIDYR